MDKNEHKRTPADIELIPPIFDEPSFLEKVDEFSFDCCGCATFLCLMGFMAFLFICAGGLDWW